MHLPAWPVLPESTLAPDAVAAKFHSRSLAGLGAEVCDEESGVCYDDGSGAGGSPGGIPTGSNSTDLTPYFNSIGFTPPPPGTPVTLPNGGTFVNQGTAAAPNYAPIYGTAIKGAIDIAKLLVVQPGTLQQGNITLRQNPGFGVPTPVTNTGLNVATSTGGGIALAAAAALVALIVLGKRS